MNPFGRLVKKIDEALEHVLFDVLLASRRRIAACALLVGVVLWAMVPGQAVRTDTGPEVHAALEAASLEYLVDRPWFDGYPVNPTPDKPYHAYMFTREGYGIFITLKSRYTQELELFYFKLQGDQLQIYLPETKVKATGKVSIGPCSGPGDFDLKLSLAADPKNGSKAKDYYSWKHWGSQGLAGLAEAVAARVQAE